MNTANLMKNMTRKFNKAGLKLKKYSPEILVVVGVAGTVTSAVMACKATLKVNEVLSDTQQDLDKIHTATEVGHTEAGADYTEEDGKKDLALVYVQTGVKFVKLYGPSVLLGAASLGCMIGSNHILRKRNVALAAAYATVDRGFKEYRGRVIERFGKELDRELRYNIKAKEIEETVQNEDGTESVVKKTVDVLDPNTYSAYSIVFDDGNTGWDPDPERSKFFLIQQQNYANEKLKAQGYLFLNDVYKMLGAQVTKAGQMVGWVYDEEHPSGDNFVDFGIFDIRRPKARDFVNGYEKVIVLDFNVDGNILDLI